MADSESRVLTLVRPGEAGSPEADLAAVSVDTGLADVVTLQRRQRARVSVQDEESFFIDTLSEYQWARDSAGLATSTLDALIKPVIEICDYYGTVPWQPTPSAQRSCPDDLHLLEDRQTLLGIDHLGALKTSAPVAQAHHFAARCPRPRRGFRHKRPHENGMQPEIFRGVAQRW